MSGNQHSLGWHETKRPTRLQRELHKMTVLNLVITICANKVKVIIKQNQRKNGKSNGRERAVVPHSQENCRENEMCRRRRKEVVVSRLRFGHTRLNRLRPRLGPY